MNWGSVSCSHDTRNKKKSHSAATLITGGNESGRDNFHHILIFSLQ